MSISIEPLVENDLDGFVFQDSQDDDYRWLRSDLGRWRMIENAYGAKSIFAHGRCIVCAGAMQPLRMPGLDVPMVGVWALFSVYSGPYFVSVFRALERMIDSLFDDIGDIVVITTAKDWRPEHGRLLSMLGMRSMDRGSGGVAQALYRQLGKGHRFYSLRRT